MAHSFTPKRFTHLGRALYGDAILVHRFVTPKKACNQAQWKYLEQLSVKTANEGDSKLFWNYVRSRRNGTNNLVTLKVDTDALTDHKDIADSFNRYFASVFTSENLTHFPNFPQVVQTENLTQASTTPIEVGKLLR